MSLNFTAMDSRQALCDFSSFKVQMCPHLFCFSKIQQHSQQKQNLKGPLEFICYDLSQSDAITQPFTTTTVVYLPLFHWNFFSKLAASGRLQTNLNCNKESFYKAYISKSFSLLLFSTTHQHWYWNSAGLLPHSSRSPCDGNLRSRRPLQHLQHSCVHSSWYAQSSPWGGKAFFEILIF